MPPPDAPSGVPPGSTSSRPSTTRRALPTATIALVVVAIAIAIAVAATRSPSPAPVAAAPSLLPTAPPSPVPSPSAPLATSLPAPSVSAPAPVPSELPPLDELGRPQLDNASIQRVLTAQNDDIRRRCWEPALRSRAASTPHSTRLVLAIAIAPAGTVDSATVETEAPGYPGLARCVATRVRQWKLPPAPGRTTLSLPFVFSDDSAPAPGPGPGPRTERGADDLPPFDKAAAQAATQRAELEATARCKRPGVPRVTVRLVITFAPTGKVTRVDLADGAIAGTPTATCVQTAFRKITVPPFSGGLTHIARNLAIGSARDP